ncbi:phytanoyl-CoA dioxygenase family protein [Devosia sp.]|uniref:phytanoyl-CoA dioxygenase family protein n=1 Tax=Devosia sp. TaxID=1871048 RepID=UPI003A908FDA
MARQLQVLSAEDAQHFIEKGYVRVKGCVDPALAKAWTDEAYTRLGYDPNDRSTWTKEIVWLDRHNTGDIKDISPKGWAALCDVTGGPERIESKVMEIESTHFTTIDSTEWSDAFVMNLNRGADKPWQPPSPEAGGWHKDGSFFRHFLDSREQALLTVVYWSDVAHKGGGTFIAPDSIKVVARYLAEHPEGVDDGDSFSELINECQEFEEITGETGDYIILHPFMLHTSSRNHSGKVRFMTNPPVVLKEPMNLNRDDPEEFSLIERATLHALGVERYDFQPTAPREERWQVIG